VDDLILNVLGIAIGYGIYAAVKHLKSKRPGLFHKRHNNPRLSAGKKNLI